MNKDHILSEDTCILLLEMSLSPKISNSILAFWFGIPNKRPIYLG